MVDIIKEISRYYSSYTNEEPISVNFRELIPDISFKDRYTHLIHPYPAKLLGNIPYFFFATDFFCPFGGTVLDPFCGTGTVLLEALASGRNALGADANPLAVLISKAKTTYIPKEVLINELHTVINRAKRSHVTITDVESLSLIDRWFSKSTIIQLKNLEDAIVKVREANTRQFFELCFSCLVKKVSYADPSISVPVILNPERFQDERKNSALFRLKTLENVDVYDKFESICLLNINRVDSLKELSENGCSSHIISDDARCLTKSLESEEKLPDESVDFILTSPPYAGAQKYIRSSWLNLFWLGTKSSDEIRVLKRKNIGREDYHINEIGRVFTGIEAADRIIEELFMEGHQERSYVVGNYINEMKVALDESIRVLKRDGYFVVVIGNNTVCGRPFDTQDYLTSYLKSRNLTLQFKLIDDIRSYGLMTKRNKTASKISCEWILVFRKS